MVVTQQRVCDLYKNKNGTYPQSISIYTSFDCSTTGIFQIIRDF